MSLVGRLFAAARTVLQSSVDELASRSGLSVSTLRNIEGGAARQKNIALKGVFQDDGIFIDEDRASLSFVVPANQDEFSTVISVARVAGGLSQMAVAGLSGVSRRTIIALEKSSATASQTVRDAVAACFVRQGIIIARDQSTDRRWMVSISSDSSEALQPDMSETSGGIMNARESISSGETYPDPSERGPGMLKYRIELEDVPFVWREIVIAENATFGDLHAAIQIAFGWHDKYSHEFRCGVEIGLPNPDDDAWMHGVVDERLVRLNQVYHDVTSFVYRYGKGEHWLATLTSMGGAHVQRSQVPLVLAGAGASIPDEAWSEQWSEMAQDLREGTADEDTRNWLHMLGYGRDYDPDKFDMELTNYNMEKAGFAIPTSWKADHAKRQLIKASLDKVLPKDTPRPPLRTSVPKKADYTITKIESIGLDDVIFDPNFGQTTSYPKKAGGLAKFRSDNEGLVALLEVCPDVASFQSFPLAIHWESGMEKGTFQPDFRIPDKAGNEVLVHVAFSQEEADFALAIAKKLSLNMKVIAGGCLNEEMVLNAIRLGRESRSVDEAEIDGIVDALKLENGSISTQHAVHRLATAGFGRQLEGFSGGNPQARVIMRLSKAIACGLVGMDFSHAMDKTIVGDPTLTVESCGFWKLFDEYAIN
jgi:transcriptional regulator with XRE-family HTH domain